jgi:hypothetical protein
MESLALTKQSSKKLPVKELLGGGNALAYAIPAMQEVLCYFPFSFHYEKRTGFPLPAYTI